MKGFQQRTESSGKFFVVKHNTICEESSKERAGFEPVEVMNPTTKEVTIKFIKRYDALEAMVTKIEWRDTGEQYDQRYMSWKIHLDADGETGVLEIPFNSRVGDRFMKMAENLDFTKPVELRAWRDNEDKTAFIIKQDDQNIPQRYTKADPGKCPPPIQRFGGKWDFADQSEFLHSQMMTVVIPKLEAARGMAGSNGHEPSYSEPEPQAAPPAPATPDRETLIGEIATTLKELNTAGDMPKWTKASVLAFVNEKYEVEDGVDSLTPTYLADFLHTLKKRLLDIDIPF